MVQQRLLDPNKLTVIPQCRVLDDFLGISPKLLGQKLILGAYGRFSTQKGFDILLQAMQSLPNLDIELHLGGYGEDETKLRHLAESDCRIQFIGKLTNVPKFL